MSICTHIVGLNVHTQSCIKQTDTETLKGWMQPDNCQTVSMDLFYLGVY